jgi:hypothetical protein
MIISPAVSRLALLFISLMQLFCLFYYYHFPAIHLDKKIPLKGATLALIIACGSVVRKSSASVGPKLLN